MKGTEGRRAGGERGGVEESEASARTNAHPLILIGTYSAASLRQRGRLPRPLPEGMLLSYSLFPSFMSSRSYHSSSYSQIPRHSLSMTPLLFGLISARSFTGRNPGRRRVRREGERKGWLNVEHVSCGLNLPASDLLSRLITPAYPLQTTIFSTTPSVVSSLSFPQSRTISTGLPVLSMSVFSTAAKPTSLTTPSTDTWLQASVTGACSV